MASYYTFTVQRTTEPHPETLLKQLKAADPTAGYTREGVRSVIVKKATAWTEPQKTAVQNILETAPATTPQLVAQAAVDALPLAEKAWKLIEVEEFNRLRGALRALGAPGLPDLTLDGVVAAWRTKAGENL